MRLTGWCANLQTFQAFFLRFREEVEAHFASQSKTANEGEIDVETMCAKFAHMGKDGDQTYNTEVYSIDVVISVGYRVHSLRGVEFRRWATSVLKEYVLRGYAINRNRLM